VAKANSTAVASKSARLVSLHSRRQFIIDQQLRHAELQRTAAACALDRLPFGIILVDVRGRVVLANQLAKRLLSAGDGLHLHRGVGGLVANQIADSVVLHETIAAVIARPTQEASVMLAIRRNSKRKPFNVLVTPLVCREGADDGVLAGLFIDDPARQPEISPVLLRQYYQLTPAEARLACLLAAGKRLDQAATQLGVKTQTVRAQLKRIFDKLGVSRQAELVHVLLTSPLVLSL
jgi:DNA-binding CsgD family transcriptional regulator